MGTAWTPKKTFSNQSARSPRPKIVPKLPRRLPKTPRDSCTMSRVKRLPKDSQIRQLHSFESLEGPSGAFWSLNSIELRRLLHHFLYRYWFFGISVVLVCLGVENLVKIFRCINFRCIILRDYLTQGEFNLYITPKLLIHRCFL